MPAFLPRQFAASINIARGAAYPWWGGALYKGPDENVVGYRVRTCEPKIGGGCQTTGAGRIACATEELTWAKTERNQVTPEIAAEHGLMAEEYAIQKILARPNYTELNF